MTRTETPTFTFETATALEAIALRYAIRAAFDQGAEMAHRSPTEQALMDGSYQRNQGIEAPPKADIGQPFDGQWLQEFKGNPSALHWIRLGLNQALQALSVEPVNNPAPIMIDWCNAFDLVPRTVFMTLLQQLDARAIQIDLHYGTQAVLRRSIVDSVVYYEWFAADAQIPLGCPLAGFSVYPGNVVSKLSLQNGFDPLFWEDAEKLVAVIQVAIATAKDIQAGKEWYSRFTTTPLPVS